MFDGTLPSPIKVALAGAGLISWYHLRAWAKITDRATVVAVCDPDRNRAEQRAREFDIAHVCATADELSAEQEIHAIDVASPRQTHAHWIEEAARRGLAILCQKPLTPTLDEAEALVRRLDPDVRLMVHENWRFRPWYRQVKDWIAAGELGEIQHAQLSAIDSGLLPDAGGRRPHLERQPFLANEPRLMITEALIHHLDVMRFLCGPLRVVAARALCTLAEVEGDSMATIFLETMTGAPVLVNGSMAAPGYPANVWLKKPWCVSYWSGRPTEDWMFSQAYADDSSWNDTFWKHARFNTLLKQARAELDEAKRREMYVEMQTIVRDEGGAVIPMFANHVSAHSKKLAHEEHVAGNWESDGGKLIERWWFA